MQIPDLNIFMAAQRPDMSASAPLPEGYFFRTLRPDELEFWMTMPIDDPAGRPAFLEYMRAYFRRVYAPREELFFERCTVMCLADGRVLGTCMLWPAYNGAIDTVHWFKVLPEAEGRGLGRALLGAILRGAAGPVYLHTQPSSFRAIKLYSDFGFRIVRSGAVGSRKNEYAEALPYLRESMGGYFERIGFIDADTALLDAAASSPEPEF